MAEAANSCGEYIPVIERFNWRVAQWCTFEGAKKQVLLLGWKSACREKLEWLEEAENPVLQMRANHERDRKQAFTGH